MASHLSPLHKALSLIPAPAPQVSRFVVGSVAHELAAIASTYAHLHPCHDDELAALACDEPGLINPAMWVDHDPPGILQARAGSSRLPGKVLKPLLPAPPCSPAR